MSPVNRSMKLAALWGASCLCVSLPVAASDWTFYGFGATHQYLDVIVGGYDELFGGFGGSGGTSGGADPRTLTDFWTLGVGAHHPVYAISDTTFLGVSGEMGLSYARYSMPDGVGIFVDPVTITSHSLFADGKFFGETRSQNDRFSAQLGVGLSAVLSYEDFYLGSIHIKEKSVSTDPYGFVGASVKVSQRAKIAVSATQRSDDVTGSVRLEISR